MTLPSNKLFSDDADASLPKYKSFILSGVLLIQVPSVELTVGEMAFSLNVSSKLGANSNLTSSGAMLLLDPSVSDAVNSLDKERTVIVNVSPLNVGIAKLVPRNDLGIHAINGSRVPNAKAPLLDVILSFSLHPLIELDCCPFKIISSDVDNLVMMLSSSKDTIDTSSPPSTLYDGSETNPDPNKLT